MNLGVQLTVPRKITIPIIRHYQETIFEPVLNEIAEGLAKRFSGKNLDSLLSLQVLSLGPEDRVGDDMLSAATRLCGKSGSQNRQRLRSEIELWTKVKKAKNQDVLQLLSSCSKETFPLMNKFLQGVATLPVSNACAERSFSTLRRLKTFLRSTTTQERLSALAIIHINKNVKPRRSAVIERFASKKQRRIDL